jgi:hypothetical protein
MHGGIVSVVNSAEWIRHWRYPNDVMLAMPWPTFFGLVAAAYLLLNLSFSCLYWLDRHHIGGDVEGIGDQQQHHHSCDHPRGKLALMLAARPLPVTRPMRALIT